MSSRRRFTVDDLFTDTRPQAAGVSDLVNAKEIRLDRIVPDPDQPRTSIDDDSLKELADSVRQQGILQPIAVRYDDAQDVYIVIHGERRWRAARQAGLESIPAIVREIDQEHVLLQQLMENIVREDLNALDRAQALRALKDQMDDAPWDQVAEAVGIRRSRLFQLLGTEKLSDGFRALLRDGVVSEKQTRAVQRLDEDVQEELAERISDGRLDSADLDEAARSVRDASSAAEAAALLDLAQAVDTDPVLTRLYQTAGRQTKRLSKSLDELRGRDLSDELRQDLAGLRREIDELLDQRN
ncbi:MAG: ParB/RepB/Spo0J family partition protein [Thermomicrobiales bacterium]